MEVILSISGAPHLHLSVSPFMSALLFSLLHTSSLSFVSDGVFVASISESNGNSRFSICPDFPTAWREKPIGPAEPMGKLPSV